MTAAEPTVAAPTDRSPRVRVQGPASVTIYILQGRELSSKPADWIAMALGKVPSRSRTLRIRGNPMRGQASGLRHLFTTIYPSYSPEYTPGGALSDSLCCILPRNRYQCTRHVHAKPRVLRKLINPARPKRARCSSRDFERLTQLLPIRCQGQLSNARCSFRQRVVLKQLWCLHSW